MQPIPPGAQDSALVVALRRGLMAVFLFGVLGMTVELFLLEHTEDWKQWTPIVLLVSAVFLAIWTLARPTLISLRVFSLTMAAFVLAGALGTWYHYRGNVEFELERTPELGGVGLFAAAMGGATPALAPGTMIQLGLIGLLFTFRHPARLAGRNAHQTL
ncbi:MAG: hypothetical protein ACT4P7_09800 [Gemmatimonadaceae bacterium]